MNNKNYITEEEARVTDVVWYGVDTEGYVARFNSGGAGIPGQLTWINVEKLYNYFLKDAPMVSEWIDDPNFLSLLSPVELRGQLESRQDLSRPCELNTAVSKGVYYYEGTLHDPADIHYYRAMLPTKPILFQELPLEIQNCFEGEPLPLAFAETKIFEDNIIPNWI